MPALKVLVAVASKHGATAAIAREIGEVLSRRGFETHVENVDKLVGAQSYDAVVIGSAVYSGRWLGTAREFIKAGQQDLASKPVWLFSSGPIGAPPLPGEDPVDVSRLLAQTHARGHTIFAGKLDRQRLNFAERAIVNGLRAPEGDYRDWPAIREWANDIASELDQLLGS